jgi:transcriptional regulator GlxA family with amidase domain
VRYILGAFEDYQSEPFGYEFLVREKLSRLWLLIISNHQEILFERQTSNDMDLLRLKDMLTFIHANYANRLELHDIAKAASISERESLRCFKRTINISPMQYLLRYRISVAADMLANSSMKITEICNQTGFESPSYFSLIFKKLIDITPQKYRNTESSKAK